MGGFSSIGREIVLKAEERRRPPTVDSVENLGGSF